MRWCGGLHGSRCDPAVARWDSSHPAAVGDLVDRGVHVVHEAFDDRRGVGGFVPLATWVSAKDQPDEYVQVAAGLLRDVGQHRFREGAAEPPSLGSGLQLSLDPV